VLPCGYKGTPALITGTLRMSAAADVCCCGRDFLK